jgi:hypothetical protein
VGAGHSEVRSVGADELAALVAAMGRPPIVDAYEVLPGGDSPAALLAWGRHLPSRRWAAGIAFIYTIFRGGPIRALVTIWLPSTQVTRRRGETYGKVPQVALAGRGPEDWPALPPVYPGASAEWAAAHHHATHVDPARRYGLRPTLSPG